MKIYVVQGIVNHEGCYNLVARTSEEKAQHDVRWLAWHKKARPTHENTAPREYAHKLEDWRQLFRSRFTSNLGPHDFDCYCVEELELREDAEDDRSTVGK